MISLAQHNDGFNYRSQLGKGTFGSVFTIPSGIIPSSVPLCVKFYHYSGHHKSLLARACKEALNLSALSHVKGVPRIVAVCDDKPPAIVMTQHGSSTLWDLLRFGAKDTVLLEILRQVTVIVHNIHQAGFTHNDLKANNISVPSVENNVVSDVFILDFDQLNRLGNTSPFERKRTKGSDKIERKKLWKKREAERSHRYYWIAPELYHDGKSSTASDVYAICQLMRRIMMRLNHKPSKAMKLIKRGTSSKPYKRPKLPDITQYITRLITDLSSGSGSGIQDINFMLSTSDLGHPR